jgi:hypothetical protein
MIEAMDISITKTKHSKLQALAWKIFLLEVFY